MKSLWNVWNPRPYLQVVSDIASEERLFDGFRRNRTYRSIVETVSEDEGRGIFKTIADPRIHRLLNDSQAADTIGHPRTYRFDGAMLAPTTVRYAKIVEELAALYDDLRGVQRICEVGVGYGGQARMLCQYLQREGRPAATYTLVDIENPLRIAKKYLENFSFENRFRYKTRSELPARPEAPYDLFISNYAFSEFNRAMQEEYLQKVILHAKRGYLLMNNGATVNGQRASSKYGNDECMLDIELLQKIPNSRIVRDSALTAAGGYLLAFHTPN